MYNYFEVKIIKISFHKFDNNSLKSFKFKGLDNTYVIPASKQFTISDSLVNAVKPIILMEGIF